MKLKGFIAIAVLILLGCSHAPSGRETVFQQSTIDALLQGNYQSKTTFAEIKRHGDFGIGTFADLDGEMAAYDGNFYQIKSDGKVYPVTDSMTTPFAAVSFFETDFEHVIEQIDDFAALETAIDAELPTKNIFYAIKVEGVFKEIKVRSVPKQSRPYKPLVEVVKSQPVYTYTDIRGTLVGFRCPDYVKGINVPGYHFHFIDEAQKVGGHVLSCRIRDAVVKIDATHGFEMALLDDEQFYHTALGRDQSEDLKKVEE